MALIQDFYPELQQLADDLPRHKTVGGHRSKKSKPAEISNEQRCQRKIRYFTIGHVLEAQERQPHLYRYRCDICGFYHLTRKYRKQGAYNGNLTP